MDLTTYAGLQDAVVSFSRRTDIAAIVPAFIALAEAELNTMLRTRKMVGRATITISAEYGAIPSDFAGVRSFDVAGTPARQLMYRTPDQLVAMRAAYRSTQPTSDYTIVGSEFRYYPAPVSPATYSAELTYWQRIPALSDSNTSNWLLAAHPHIYLYGALVQLAIYVKNADLQDQYFSAWSLLIAALVASDMRDDIGDTLTPIPSTVV